jgi:aspartyl-tRNA synthetase
MIPNIYRTLHCNAVRKEHIGQTVTLCGWVNSARDHGGVIFIDLRDREGLTQVVFRPEENAELAARATRCVTRTSLQVTGKVAARLTGTENAKLGTGDVEIVATEFKILNKADVLPFQLDRELSNEDLRMKYRYLDLRRERMNKNIRTRHKITNAAATTSTPPASSKSRRHPQQPDARRRPRLPRACPLNPGKFYALPQAPQQYKQLMMVAGLERYFQIARCFRDEDLRADRQPEFTQIDIEASFISGRHHHLVEGLLVFHVQSRHRTRHPPPFPRMTYQEAMDRYGSDKPDTRYGNEIVDMAGCLREQRLQNLPQHHRKRRCRARHQREGLRRHHHRPDDPPQRDRHAGRHEGEAARLHQGGARCERRARIQIPLWKFFSEDEQKALIAKLGVEENDIVFFYAGTWQEACDILGRVRVEIANMCELTKDSTALNFLWVVDFPLLAYDAESQSWVAVHHPFTRPKTEDIPLMEAGEYAKVRAEAYDVVLNGYELGGGSIRIHEKDLQAKMFSVLGVSEEEQPTNSATSSTPSASAHLRTAVSRSASTASPCWSAARTASAKSSPSRRTTRAAT